jgi:hypothetical protein
MKLLSGREAIETATGAMREMPSQVVRFNSSMKHFPVRRSFSSSRLVQSQSEQAQGSVPFSWRQFRRA